MNIEHRAGLEFRVQGRTLSGTAMRYGDTSPDFNERFLPGAFAPVPDVPMRLQHDAGMEILPAGGFVLNDTPRALEVRAELPAGSGPLALVRRGALSGWSVGFHARAERREAGVRVIERAQLVEISLVDSGAYPGATAEVRARSGRTLRQTIPTGTKLGCECSGIECRFAEFMQEEMGAMLDRAFEGAVRDVLAVRGSYGTPLASASRGGVRARMVGADAVVDVDLPDGPDGAAVLRDVENTGAVVIRPYLDRSSRGRKDGETMIYDRDNPAELRSFVVGATDAREGWPAPEIIRTPDELMPEGRGARAPGRHRRTPVWL